YRLTVAIFYHCHHRHADGHHVDLQQTGAFHCRPDLDRLSWPVTFFHCEANPDTAFFPGCQQPGLYWRRCFCTCCGQCISYRPGTGRCVAGDLRLCGWHLWRLPVRIIDAMGIVLKIYRIMKKTPLFLTLLMM